MRIYIYYTTDRTNASFTIDASGHRVYIYMYNDNISATAFTLESYFSRAPAVLSSRCSGGGGGVTCVLDYIYRWEHRIIIIITALIVNGLVRLLKSTRWKNIHSIYGACTMVLPLMEPCAAGSNKNRSETYANDKYYFNTYRVQ